jgi:hypothetical protein
MEDESVYYALSKGAKKYAENFKMSTILPKYVKFYYKLVNNNYLYSSYGNLREVIPRTRY